MNVYSFIQMIDSDLVYSELYPGTLGPYYIYLSKHVKVMHAMVVCHI